MKTIVNLSNFFHQNEPKIASQIGNISLLLAFVGGSIIGLPSTLAGFGIAFALPVALATTAKYCLAAGGIIKMATKFFGTVDANGVPTTTTIQSTIPTAPVLKPEDKK